MTPSRGGAGPLDGQGAAGQAQTAFWGGEDPQRRGRGSEGACPGPPGGRLAAAQEGGRSALKTAIWGDPRVITGELGDPFYPTRTPRTAHRSTRAHRPSETQTSSPLHLDEHTLPLASQGDSGLCRLLRPSPVCPEAHTEGWVGLPSTHPGVLEPGDGAAGAGAGPMGPLLL